MNEVKVVKVKPWGKKQGDHVLINEVDFNPKRHTLIEGASAPDNGEREAAPDAQPRNELNAEESQTRSVGGEEYPVEPARTTRRKKAKKKKTG